MVFFPLCASPIVRVLFMGLPSRYVSYVSTHETPTWSSAAERIENVYRGLV